MSYTARMDEPTRWARGPVAWLDERGRPAWIVAMVVGFVVFWPVGLAILFFMLWSGRMGHWGRRGRWHGAENSVMRGCGWHGRRHRYRDESTGNRAFDEYRDETLRRLEDEQREFEGFLERLRHAKDKAEFDQFMEERRNRPAEPEAGDDTPPAQG